MPSIVNATTTAGVAVSGDNSGVLALQTNNGTTAVTIDTSQNVGIGTSSPSARLHVSTSAAGIAEPVWLNNSQAVGAGVGSRLVFTGTTSNNGLAAIDGAFAGATTADGGYMVFNTRAVTSGTLTERMRITSAGNVGIGTSSPKSVGNYTFVTTNATTGSGYTTYVNGTEASNFYANSSATVVQEVRAANMIFETSATERFRIASSGETTFTGNTTFSAANFSGKLGTASGYGYWSNSDVSSYIQINGSSNAVPYRVYVSAQSGGVYMAANGTSWTANSDVRLKNITGTFTNALADVLQIEAVKFTWKSDAENRPCVGLIAQSVEKVLPEAVSKGALNNSEDKTEYLGVQYTEVIPLLVAAIQELKATVDAQAAEIAALKGVK